MNIETKKTTLLISGITELTAAKSTAFKNDVRDNLGDAIKEVIVDCSLIEFIDSSGLGALISVNKAADQHGAELSLKSPSPTATQLLELTRLHRVLKISN